MKKPALLLLMLPFLATQASAQVVITEIQPNPTGSDFAEWIEIQNIGNTPVAIGGWEFHEFVAGVPSSLWAFPAGLMLSPTQVVVVTKQHATFNMRATIEWNGFQPDFEMAIGLDSAMIPNVSGGPNFNLEDDSDAVILMDDVGGFVDGVEWGTDRPEVPGAPVLFWPQLNEGISIRRTNAGGMSTATDFSVALVTDPGVGYVVGMGSPPMIIGPMRSPPAFSFTKTASMSVIVTDTDGVMGATFYIGIARDVGGVADGPYVDVPATAAMNTYSVGGAVENLAGGIAFAEPTNFHDRYVRWFVEATDQLGASGKLPMMATTDASNTEFYWENVLTESMMTSIADAREQDVDEAPIWAGHSVRVEGVVLTDQTAFSDVASNFYLASPTGIDAVRVFDDVLNPVDVAPGDVIQLEGKIGVVNGVRQIGQDERVGNVAEHRGNEIVITKVGTDDVPIQVVTIATLLSEGERYESQLVEIQNVEFVQGPGGEPPPTTFAADSTVYVSDSTRMPVRIFGNTTVPGRAAPMGMFAIRGIVSQSTPMGGYQILPRFIEDIDPAPVDVDAGVVDAGDDIDGGQIDDAGSNPDDAGGTATDAGTAAPDSGQGGGGGDKDPEGCSCDVAQAERGGAHWLWLVMAAVVLRRRR